MERTRPPSIIRGPPLPPLLNITFGELIRQQSRKHAERVAVISQQQDEIITYTELHNISDNLAAGLLATGVKRGDRVAVMLGNRSEYVHVCVYPGYQSVYKWHNTDENRELAVSGLFENRCCGNFAQLCIYLKRNSKSLVFY
jgi:hypothetical protein